MLLDDFRNEMQISLNSLYNPAEINELSYQVISHVLGLSRAAIALSRKQKLNNTHEQKLKAILDRLQTGEPVQYVIGFAQFLEFELQVTKDTLIPRPETEELVEVIFSNFKSNYPKMSILDIGTGSGCIAIALSARFNNAQVDAIDVSEEALKVAKSNAKQYGLSINFLELDILSISELDKTYDVIVSNPPYVRVLEKKQMHVNVLDFEPDSALFVSDDDPLVFYRKIATLSKRFLNPNGYLFFEINEYLGTEMVKMLVNLGFRDVKLIKDIFGKNRIIIANK